MRRNQKEWTNTHNIFATFPASTKYNHLQEQGFPRQWGMLWLVRVLYIRERESLVILFYVITYYTRIMYNLLTWVFSKRYVYYTSFFRGTVDLRCTSTSSKSRTSRSPCKCSFLKPPMSTAVHCLHRSSEGLDEILRVQLMQKPSLTLG